MVKPQSNYELRKVKNELVEKLGFDRTKALDKIGDYQWIYTAKDEYGDPCAYIEIRLTVKGMQIPFDLERAIADYTERTVFQQDRKAARREAEQLVEETANPYKGNL